MELKNAGFENTEEAKRDAIHQMVVGRSSNG